MWSRAPFMRLTIPFASGIIVAKTVGAAAAFSSFSICLLFILFLWLRSRESYFSRFSLGLTVWFLMFAFGLWLSGMADPARKKSHYAHNSDQLRVFIVKVLDIPKVKNGNTRLTAEVRFAGDSTGVLYPCSGNVMLQFFQDSSAQHIGVDELLVVHAPLSEQKPPDVPHSFDYGKYLRLKGIYKILQPQRGHWTPWQKQKETSFKGYLLNIRERWIAGLDHYSIHPNSRGIIEALVWGKTDDVDREQMQAYTRTGVVHILAVSGMHVGLIYLLTQPITRRIRGRKWAVFRFLLPAAILWFYAAITGFSPSVSRAALMLSLIIISEQFEQPSESMNMFFTSMFILLLIDPAMMMHIGFQLSYAAVLGIMLFQAPLKKIFHSRYRPVRIIGEMSAVSVAAQLMAMPLCLYHFHQFPVYFLLANLLAVPLSTIVLYCGLVFFSFSFFEPIRHISINLCDTLIRVMDRIIECIDQWPHAVISRIPFDFTQVILSYILLLSLYQWLVHQKNRQVIVSLMCLFLFSIHSILFDGHQHRKEHCFLVHRHRSHTYCSLMSNRELQLFIPSALLPDTSAIIEKWNDFRAKEGVRSFTVCPFEKGVVSLDVQSERKVNFFHPEYRHTVSSATFVFGPEWSKKFIRKEQLPHLENGEIHFDGKWSFRKRETLLRLIRNANFEDNSEKPLNIAVSK